MTKPLQNADILELIHISSGGTSCIDGRKQRKLIRLKLIKEEDFRLKITGYGKSVMDGYDG